MRRPHLLPALLATACASPWASVKNAKTLDEARALLGGYQPSVETYGPTTEAWYFGKNECVLFVDGRLRVSKSSYTETESGRVASSKQQQVVCSPMDVKD